MKADKRICFNPFLPSLKRPRTLGGSICPRTIIYQQRYSYRQSAINSQWIQRLSMSSKDSTAMSNLEAPTERVLPSGAFTLLLKVMFPDPVSVLDQKLMLSEYGRGTCAEQGVLRCDILYEVNSRNLPKNKFYEIWITFADSQAYLEHERSAHASKLRLCLNNPTGGDNSVMLTKLAYEASLLKPVRPDIPSWKSSFDYANRGNEPGERIPLRPSRSTSHEGSNGESSAAVRRSLNMLLSSVGLEDVKILISTATAKCQESSRRLRKACEDYLVGLEKSAGIVRTGLLVSKNDPFKIVLMTVHDASDDDGACFDMELGANFLNDEEWKLRRCFAVFPDKGGWEIRVDEDDISAITPEGVTILGPQNATRGLVGQKEEVQRNTNKLEHRSHQELVGAEQPQAQSPKLRLLQGPGAFDSLKQYLREMTRMPSGDLRAMIIYGWNTSRIHDLIVQLEYDKQKDFGVIHYTIDFNVRSMDLTTARLERGVAEVHRFRPDVIIGYGGGTVMDMAKALSHLGNAGKTEVEAFAELIDTSAERNEYQVSITKASLSVPVMLIPTTIGSGSELTEPCIFSARKRDGSWRRIPVHFCEEADIVRPSADKTVLVDSRLLGPKRLSGFHASQGALQLACLGIDVLISAHEHLEEQYANFAFEGISLAFKGVIPSLREPYKATGQSRDPLLSAKTAIGLARDGVGRMGVCLRLTLSVIDSLIDGRYPTMFRMVLTRVTISVISELFKMPETIDDKRFKSVICKALQVNEEDEAVEAMLSRAEDCNVLLLKEVGMVRRRIPDIAKYVAGSFAGPEYSTFERLFEDPARIEGVLLNALSQEYKL